MERTVSNRFLAAGGERFSARREIRWGYLVLALFFGGVLAWSALAPLSTATLASGVATVDGYRKSVQHLEGGIIERILVRDGDVVETDEPLIELQRLTSETEFALLHSQRALTAAEEARLAAEHRQADRIEFPDWLLDSADDPQIAEALAGQRTIFETRTRELQDRLQALELEAAEANTELASYQAKSEKLARQRRLAWRELREFRAMAEEGLVPRTQLYSRERLVTEADTDIDSNLATIAAVEQRIGKLRAAAAALRNERETEVAEQLRQTQERLLDIEHRIREAADTLARTTVRAPVDGIVVNLQVHTIGGVVKPGQTLLELVPRDEELIVEARIDPKDRDRVAIGMPAEVRFSAFNQRAFQPVPAEVFHVSADAIQQIDQQSGQMNSHYRAKLRLTRPPGEILGGALIQPGMQADVLIVTGERTAIEYFAAPLFRSFNRAMREQ